MMQKYDTNKIAFLILAFLLLIFVESFFFGNANILYVLLGVGLLYYGTKQRSKWTFMTGVFLIVIALFNLWSLRLFTLGVFAYILYKLWKGVPAEEILRPIREFKKETPNGIWKNKLFSIQTSPFSSYEWEDIHIQGVFGDISIDVTDTVLPKGTSLISIRQAIGKIKIELPYEIPVRVHYTTLYGEAKVFHYEKKRLVNEFLHMKDGYLADVESNSELIITIATWAGDVEVVRK